MRHFRKPVYDLLVAFQKRIESGSNIKAGPFEITDQLRPQDHRQQKEKIALELAEDLTEDEAAPLEAEQHADIQSHPQSTITRQTKYFQAEDLVLRAIQAEYGSTVSRQVTAGADIGFDGVFVANGRLNIVEVKYLSRSIPNTLKLKESVNRVFNAISSYNWKDTQIILAVVFEKAEDIKSQRARLQSIFNKSHLPVVVKCYSLAELQQKFQISEE